MTPTLSLVTAFVVTLVAVAGVLGWLASRGPE